MKTSVFESQVCSVARALEIIGEWWTLLIVREAFFGTTRFSDFQTILGIAKNVLSDRLSKLVESGLMERSQVAGRGNPLDYRLTEKGAELFPVLISLMQWGDRWINGPERAPVKVLDRDTGEEISRIEVRTAGNRVISLDDAVVVPGPGANEAIRRRFGRSSKQEETPD